MLWVGEIDLKWVLIWSFSSMIFEETRKTSPAMLKIDTFDGWKSRV